MITNHITNSIEDLINEYDWIVGAQNFDEDLHFSSFYIRLSSKKYLGKRSKIGYQTIIAVYQDFDEIYYIPISECDRVAKYLLERVKKEPKWMSTIVTKIYQRCDELNNVFANYNINSDFSMLSDEQIVGLLRKHYTAHWKLYQVARIPEALDRGAEIFTGYLKNYLSKKCRLSDPREINELFYKLTMPDEPSIFQEEIFELLEIIKNIETTIGQRELYLNQDRRLIFKADPRILKDIYAHIEKWGFLEYHGYGYRSIPDLNHYIARICAYLRASPQWSEKKEHIMNTIVDEKIALYGKYHIDETHQKLFVLYANIGLSKLFRRYIQLRNFYFLDKLIHQIGLRMGCEEGMIRCLLPEEIENLMDGKLKIDGNIRNRLDFIVYMIHRDDEIVFSGYEYKWIKEKLDAKLKRPSFNANELYGTPVSLGCVEGTCKIVVRPQDAICKGFKNGEILISESTDPDLIGVITKAGGVVTQQGGVTSHASIICRELGKPALVGVQNLLDIVHDGDRAIIDAYKGTLVIVQKRAKYKLIVKPEEVNIIELQLSNRIGNKALNLSKLKKSGFVVPQFFVIPTDLLHMNMDKEGLCADNLEILHSLMEEMRNACNEIPTETVAIRSSFSVEDDKYNSKAGNFPTWTNIGKANIGKHFKEYVSDLLKKFMGIPEGGIIIQEMINSDISGVCFTTDPVSHDRNTIVIEVVQGPNFGLTGGTQSPDMRIKMNKYDYDVLSKEQYTEKDFITGQQIRDMVKILIEIERYFDYPQDIEWAICAGKFFVLQSRPITTI